METEELGIRGFLSNPVNVRRINRAIGRALRHKRRGGLILTRILVVDSDVLTRGAVVRSLSRAGYDVRGAADESEAMNAYCEQPADLVIADLNMPAGEGLETVASFRRHFPDLRILAISPTPGPLDSNVAVCTTLGATRTMVRPFDNEELLDAVRDLSGI
jgi:two-component system chemotaxis response regulator CheY